MQAKIGANRRDSDEKMKKLTEELKAMITSIMDKKYSRYKNDLPKSQDPINLVPDKSKVPPLDDVNSTKIGGMWNLKDDIRSPKFYELLIKT